MFHQIRYADGFPGANGGAQIQAAINDCPATKCTVFVAAGTYSVTSSISVSGKTNFALILDKGAVLQAATGMGPNPIVQVAGASADVLIQGGIFDANSIAALGIQVAGTSNRVTILGVEVKNTVTAEPGIGIISTAAGGYEVGIYDSYIHDTNGSCIFAQFIGVVRIERNRCANSTAGQGIQGGGQQFMQVVNNKISGINATDQNGIYCFGCDRVDWRGNEITNSYRGMHCDTCGAGNISGNLLDNLKHWGIHAEKAANFSIHGNEVRNTGTTVAADAVVLSGVDSTSINVLDSIAGLTASANVTLSTDGADKQEGAASVQAAIAAAFTTGLVFFQDFGANQTSFLDVFKDLWIKSGTALGAGVLSLGTDGTLNCASLDRTVKLPQLPANTWVRLQQFVPSFQFDTNVTGIRCWAITANSDPGAVTLKFDDFRASGRNIGDVLSNNRVYWPNGTCFKFNNMIGGEIRGNYCEDAGFANAGARNAYVFEAATNPIASDNEVRYTAKGAGQPGQFFNLDATSTVTEVGNRGTNVDTFAVVAAGGKLLRLDPDTAAGGGLTVDGDANTTIQAKSTAAGTPTAYLQGGSAGVAALGSSTNHPLSFRVNQIERATLNSSGVMGAAVFDASTGFRVAGAAASGRYLKGDGTNFIVSTGSASGVGACPANQWANATNSDAAPTCAQPGFSNLSGTATKAQLPAAVAYEDEANIFTAGQRIETIAAPLILRETDQVLPAGLWRIVTDNDTLRLDKNTAAAGDFSTFASSFQVPAGGTALLPVTSGNDLGSASLRWDGFLNGLDLYAATTFAGSLTHAITAARTWTLPDAAGNIPVLPTAATAETGSGAIARATSPTLTGTVTIDRRLEFTEAAGDPACAAGDFWISVTTATNVLRKCQNGALSNLDTGGSGGHTITVNGSALASATAADLDDATPAAPSDGVNVRWQKDALDPTNISANLQFATGALAGAVSTAVQTFAGAKTFTGNIVGQNAITADLTTVTFGATPTFDADLGNSFKITLTGNVTSSTLSNADTGQMLSWIICQDATGLRTFVWPTNVKGGMTIGSSASTCSAQVFLFDGTNAWALSSGSTDM